MKTISKRLSAVLLSVYMVFGVVSTDYLQVQAFEWIVPQLSFSEALPFLLGVLGVFAEGEKLESGYYDYSSMEEDMDAYMIDWGIVADDLEEWKNKIVGGSLNQASNCWTAFKSWVKSFIGSSPGDGTWSSGGSFVYSDLLSDLNAYYNFNANGLGFDSLTSVCDVPVVVLDISNNIAYVIPYGTELVKTFYSSSAGNKYLNFQCSFDSTTANVHDYFVYDFTNGVWNSSYVVSTNVIRIPITNIFLFNFSVYGASSSTDFLSTSGNWVFNYNNLSLDSSDSNVNTYNPAIVPYIDLAPADSRDDAIPDVMPLPWDNVGDTDDEVKDKIAGVIDAVNTGNLSLADAMQRILDWLNALAVDTTADNTLVPENPDKPNETYPDRVQENQDNFGFTLAGFEKLFPFCIPFDIYAFMTLLVAEPVAPVIEYPIYNPVTKQNEIIRIDFSQWESVVHLFRYIFDFLFIIGMLLAARALIGGGDKA